MQSLRPSEHLHEHAQAVVDIHNERNSAGVWRIPCPQLSDLDAGEPALMESLLFAAALHTIGTAAVSSPCPM